MVGPTPLERFEAKVDLSGDCWLWTGGLDRYGYGKFTLDYRTLIAHRAGWELLVGPIESDHELDHTCHDIKSGCVPSTCMHRRCVNPDHLEPVTRAVHILRTVAAGGTECRRGHRYSDENTYRRSNGRYECRVCRRLRKAAA